MKFKNRVKNQIAGSDSLTHLSININLSGSFLSAFEAEDFASLVAGGDWAAQQFGHTDHLVDQLTAALGKDATFQIEVVFESDADIAAHDDGGSSEGEGVAADAGGRPGAAGGNVLGHPHQVVDGGGSAAEDAEDEVELHGNQG